MTEQMFSLPDESADVDGARTLPFDGEPIRDKYGLDTGEAPIIDMRTVADFKREAVPGSVWYCENFLHPRVSGKRVIKGGKTVLSYAYEFTDGRSGTNGRTEMPKASAVRIEGASVTWLQDDGTPAWTWTKVSAP